MHYWLKIAGPFETLMFCSLWSDNPSTEQQNTVRGDRNALMDYPAENVDNLMLPMKPFLSHLVQYATRKSIIKSQLYSGLKGRCSTLGKNSEVMFPSLGTLGRKDCSQRCAEIEILPREAQIPNCTLEWLLSMLWLVSLRLSYRGSTQQPWNIQLSNM